MAKARVGSLSIAAPVSSPFDLKPAANDLHVVGRGSERRAYTRLTPVELQCPITVRFKYGEAVTLLDVSTGGALLETSKRLRPDSDLVLEILDSRTRNIAQVVSRVLRSHVSGLQHGITYRGACAFKKPLSHPALVPPPPLLKTDANDFLKLEFALKTIVEGYFGRPATAASGAGRWRDESALLDALVRLRAAAERRQNPIDRQLAQLLAIVIPALQRRDSVESVTAQLQDQLARHLPLLAIRSARQEHASAPDRELMTMNVWAERDELQVAVTAEFPAGFGLDEAQFRLLKAGAYLMGLAGNWRPATPPAAETHPPADVIESPEPAAGDTPPVPIGWHQVVACALRSIVPRR